MEGAEFPIFLLNKNETLMPIKFRCAYCNQLLGISRRKVGSVVRCPTCAGQVVVPTADTEVPETDDGSSNPLVFERNDFDELLNTGASAPTEKKDRLATAAEVPIVFPAVPHPPPGAWGTHAEPAYDVERMNPVPALATAQPVAQAGIFLSRRK